MGTNRGREAASEPSCSNCSCSCGFLVMEEKRSHWSPEDSLRTVAAQWVAGGGRCDGHSGIGGPRCRECSQWAALGCQPRQDCLGRSKSRPPSAPTSSDDWRQEYEAQATSARGRTSPGATSEPERPCHHPGCGQACVTRRLLCNKDATASPYLELTERQGWRGARTRAGRGSSLETGSAQA